MSRYKPEISSDGQWGDVWRSVYQTLGQTIVSNQLTAWIQPLRLVAVDPIGDAQGGADGLAGGIPRERFRARLIAPNGFSAQWVSTHLREPLEAAFRRVLGADVELQIDVQGETAEPNLTEATGTPAGAVENEQENEHTILPLPQDYRVASQAPVLQLGGRRAGSDSQLDPHYTFQSYVVGSSNQFAHAAAAAVAEAPGRRYNPLFLYSTPGLGKTHLLHAIGNHILARNPDAKVLYCSSERFLNELVSAIRKKDFTEFHKKYRESYDVFLIDDIQFVGGKPGLEEEFFHTFNAFYSSRRQIVVTSDRPPQDLELLEERTRTRFQSGLIADISAPEIETRIAILKSKAERDDIYLPDDVATFIATHVKSNVRELEGVLIKLQMVASLTGAEISLEMTKHELKSLLPDDGAQFTVEAIQGAVMRHFKLKLQDLKSTSRARRYAFPRQIGMYLVRKYTALGYQEIGHQFGGKDHSTVLHAYQKIDGEIESNPEVRSAVEAVQNLL